MEGYDKSCSICVTTKGKGIGECPICKLTSNVGALSAKVRRFSEGRFSGLGEEHPQGCWIKAEDFDRVTAERDALQLRLNAVEEENYRLRELLLKAHPFVNDIAHDTDLYLEIDAEMEKRP